MTRIALEAGIILLLLVANGVFAMAEIAIVAARKTRLRQSAAAGNARAQVALELAESPNRFLATVQIGITLIGILAGSTIDYLIVTHPHDDHYPGQLDLLSLYQVRTIVHSGFPKTGEYEAFVRAAKAERVNGQPATVVSLREHPDFTMDWGGGVRARIIHADSATATGMGSASTRENNASTVLRVEFGAFSFLLMGDAEGKTRDGTPATARFVEADLLARLAPADLRATVLKAGHHGSETGSTLPFLQAVRPDVVVVMSGRRPFGGRFLPDDSVLDRYAEVNPDVVVLRTDEADEEEARDGTTDQDGDDIYMRTDGTELRIYQARGPDGRRRWRPVTTLPAGN
jgi:beta-lactamase superfamily II metal-dependent hydrolase